MIHGSETVMILRRTQNGVDAYNNPAWVTSEITFDGVLLAPGSSSEPVDPARDPADATATIYFPHGTVIEDGDIFAFHNGSWVRDGEADIYPAIDGFIPGVVVKVRRRRG